MYVCRGDQFVVLQRASGRGRGFWMVPGGLIEPGESAESAAKRETLEETGLVVERAEPLRSYRWRQDGDDYIREITSFYAKTPNGEVVLSDERTAAAWLTPAEYVERYCSEALGRAAPEYAGLLAELRANCATLVERLAATAL
jgi:8-oxo-dGTP pyrophosphatase MutT (NUDIX family)